MMRRFLPLVLGLASIQTTYAEMKLTIHLSIYPRGAKFNLFVSNVDCACIMKRNYSLLIFLPTTHEQLKIFQQSDS